MTHDIIVLSAYPHRMDLPMKNNIESQLIIRKNNNLHASSQQVYAFPIGVDKLNSDDKLTGEMVIVPGHPDYEKRKKFEKSSIEGEKVYTRKLTGEKSVLGILAAGGVLFTATFASAVLFPPATLPLLATFGSYVIGSIGWFAFDDMRNFHKKV